MSLVRELSGWKVLDLQSPGYVVSAEQASRSSGGPREVWGLLAQTTKAACMMRTRPMIHGVGYPVDLRYMAWGHTYTVGAEPINPTGRGI